ncbi:unnamed protein product [Closterium sp. NIES-64]|nr:unnamed protein product [Closterium sp. NIES-64]
MYSASFDPCTPPPHFSPFRPSPERSSWGCPERSSWGCPERSSWGCPERSSCGNQRRFGFLCPSPSGIDLSSSDILESSSADARLLSLTSSRAIQLSRPSPPPSPSRHARLHLIPPFTPAPPFSPSSPLPLLLPPRPPPSRGSMRAPRRHPRRHPRGRGESLGAAEQGAPPPGGSHGSSAPLGRTLVLPRVCSSRIGGNNPPRGMLPACAYFDSVLMGRFVPWVREEYLWRTVAELAKEHLAYAPHLLRLASSFAAQHLGGGQYVAAHWRIEKAMMSHRSPHTRLTCTGWPPEEQAVQHLNGGRYVAAHWRVEKAMMSHRSPVRMHLCVQWLLRETAAWPLQEKERGAMVGESGGSVEGGGGGEGEKVPVFMATDLTPENKWLSGTARFDQHHQDVAIYAPTRLESFLPGLREADLGVQAILDKLLCIRATVFLYPPVSCRNYVPTGSGSAVADEICWWREHLAQQRNMSRGGEGRTVCRMWGADFDLAAGEGGRGKKWRVRMWGGGGVDLAASGGWEQGKKRLHRMWRGAIDPLV